MAYICKRKNREGKYYVYLTEGYRVGDKVRTRNLVSYGQLDVLETKEPGIYDRLRKEAKEGLLTSFENENITVELDITEKISDIDELFGWKILDEIYRSFGIDKVLKKHSKKHKFSFDLDKIMKLLVFQRILNPASKIKTLESQKTLFGEWNVSKNDMFRSLLHLDELKDDIQLCLHKAITKKTKRVATLVFYDVTNYYFDCDYNDEDILNEFGELSHEALRKRGPSKEKKPKPIVQMGLFMDMNGIPISYKLFPGNRTDPITYIPAIEQVKKQFNVERIVTVADKAMNSARNVTDAYERGDGWIFSQKVRGSRGVAKDIQEFALAQNSWKYNADLSYAIKSKIRKRKLANGKVIEERILVTWSEKYAKREKIRRDGALEYAAKLTNAELFRMTSKKGGKRYLVQKVWDKQSEEYIEINPFIHLDLELAKEDEKFDGLNVIVTSELELDDEQILANYRQLSYIEDCFRVTKTEMNTRPIYVWTDKHIEAHFLTCFISLVFLKYLKYETNYEMSTSRIQSALASLKASKVGKGYYQVSSNEDMILLNKLLNIDFDKRYIEHEKLLKYGYLWCTT
jgi:transposase